MPKRAVYYAQKALRLPKLSEKDKLTFSMYKIEATVQLGNAKQAVQLVKDTPAKPEAVFRCSFGYATPWIDRTVEYSTKLLVQVNYAAIGLTDDAESQSKEMAEHLKILGEINDQKTIKGISPISTNLLYSYLRKGRFH
jgi:hypothetical protein